MAKLDTATDLIRYQDDYHAWALQQAALVKAGRFADLDGKNLAAQLKGLAMSEEREIESRLTILLQHLLKWEFQPTAEQKAGVRRYLNNAIESIVSSGEAQVCAATRPR